MAINSMMDMKPLKMWLLLSNVLGKFVISSILQTQNWVKFSAASCQPLREVDIQHPRPHYHKKPSVHQPSSEAFHRTAPGNRTKSPFQMRTAKKVSKRNGNNSSTTTIRTATTKKTKVSILSQRRQPNCACKCFVCEATRASTTASWNFLHVSFRQLLAISLLSTCRVNWLPSGLRQFKGKGLRFGELAGLPYRMMIGIPSTQRSWISWLYRPPACK